MFDRRSTSRSARSTSSAASRSSDGALLQQVHDVGERVEGVVDLVRDSCNQSPGGSQAFGAAQRLFEFVVQLANLFAGKLAFGYVANSGGGEGAVLGMQRAQADFDGELAAVFAQAEEFEANAHGADMGLGEEVLAMARVLAAIALGDQHLDAMSQQFRASVAEELLGLSVDQRDLALVVDDDHGVGRGFEQRAEFFFSLFSHGYVSYGARDEDTVGSLDRAKTDLEREFRTIFS